MMNDTLANALSNMINAEKRSKSVCIIKPLSKVIVKILEIIKDKNYINDFTVVKDGKGDLIEVKLKGRINDIKVIKPRYSVKVKNFEKYEKRYLPAKDFGIIMVSTPKGIMTHNEAREENLGGKLLAYCY